MAPFSPGDVIPMFPIFSFSVLFSYLSIFFHTLLSFLLFLLSPLNLILVWSWVTVRGIGHVTCFRFHCLSDMSVLFSWRLAWRSGELNTPAWSGNGDDFVEWISEGSFWI